MPHDGSRTRERILEEAERLVIDNGFSATSVDAVIRAANTSKGAFFNHFASKAELGRVLVERYVQADLDHLAAALDDVATIPDPAERAVAFVRIFEDGADELMDAQSSCLYVAVLSERELLRSATSGIIGTAVVEWRDAFARLLREAIGTRQRFDVDPEALADHIFVTFEGSFVLCRSMNDPSHMRRQLRVLRQLVERLLDDPPVTEGK